MDELIKRLREAPNDWYDADLHYEAADAIEELQKAVMRLEEENGILDELPMVDQNTPCDTCAHKGNVDYDYCHICNNESDMYKPKPPKGE
jgi:hypothetical protein